MMDFLCDLYLRVKRAGSVFTVLVLFSLLCLIDMITDKQWTLPLV